MNRRQAIAATTATLAATGAAAWFSSRTSMADYNTAVAAQRAPLPAQPELLDLVRYAALAANSHNTQPWQFRLEPGAISILPDLSRRTPAVDPDDHHLYITLGCALENLFIAASATGRPGEITVGAGEAAAITYAFTQGAAVPSPLLAAIPLRQSTRTNFDGAPIPAPNLAALHASSSLMGVAHSFVTDGRTIDEIGNLVVAANDRQMADPAFMRELRQWIRFSPGTALALGDGLFSATSGSPPLPDWLGAVVFPLFFSASSESRKYAAQIASSSGLAIFSAEKSDPLHWIQVGRACQRFALAATSLGLKCAFVNQPVEVPEFRADLAAAAGLSGRRPDILMRFGYAKAMPYSARRSVASLFLV